MKKLVKKALLVIESISSTVGCDMNDKLTIDRDVIDDIYIYSHIALGTCTNPHKDWVKRLNKHYKQLKKIGEF